MITVRQATSSTDFKQFGELCWQYVDWCRERYKDIPWLVDEVFGYQSLDEELQVLATKYAPPLGKTLLVVQNEPVVQTEELLGGGAYRRTSDTTCELKRVFVADRVKGQGLGRQLVQALIESARGDGFQLMQLDTGHRMNEAIAMYRKMGFVPCDPYHTYPEKIMPFFAFMQKEI